MYASVDTRVCRRARSEMRREFGLPSPAGAETDKKTHQSARRGTGVTRAASRTPTSGWWILVRTNRRLSEDQGRGWLYLLLESRPSHITLSLKLLHQLVGTLWIS